VKNAPKSRGKGTNSANFLIGLASTEPVEVPKHIDLTEEEARLWPQFASARSRVDWREFDLILLSKIVKLEASARRYQTMLDQSGPIIRNKKGTPIVNPLLSIIDTITRQQMAIIRSLSLTAGADPRTNFGHAAQSRTFEQYLEGDDAELFARPN
jgi:hypothetical protein